MVLTIPIRWIAAWLFAAACHECFHCLAVWIAGCRIRAVHIGALGATIRTDPLPPVSAMLCALAGPLAGVVLILWARSMPRVTLCAVLQTIFNLLPIYPLDGYVAMYSLLRLLFAEARAEKIGRLLELFVCTSLFLVCLTASFHWKLGAFPAAFAVLFLLRMKKRKIPCKWSFYAVQ